MPKERYEMFGKECRYGMATGAFFPDGDLFCSDVRQSRLCIIKDEDEENFYGHFVEGLGAAGLRFPKISTRELTEAEKQQYDGKVYGIGGVPFHTINFHAKEVV
jgi:hypothetical protein